MSDDADFDAIDLLLYGGVIAFQRGLAHAVGDAATGLLLSQFYYWSKTLAPERNGWFYKKQEEIHEETALTRREQETARRNLRNLGILEEEKRGVPATLWFRINRAAVRKLLQEQAAYKNAGKCRSRMAKSDIQRCAQAAGSSGGFRQANSKTTPENTSQNTAAWGNSSGASGGLPADVDQQLVHELLANDVNRADAIRLAREKPEECRRQLEYLCYLTPRTNPGGWLRDAVENGHGAPKAYRDAKARDADRARKRDRAALETARQSHEAAHRGAYLDYLAEREALARLSHPEAFSAFLTLEAEEKARFERTLPPAMLARVLDDHGRRESYLRRLQRFFAERTDCEMFDFRQWDAEVNPHPFRPEEEADGS